MNTNAMGGASGLSVSMARYGVPFFIAAAGLVSASVYLHRCLLRSFHSHAWVGHAQRVLALTETIESKVNEATSQSRGYVITADSTYYAAYESTKLIAQAYLSELRSWAARDLTVREEVEALDKEVHTVFGFNDRLLAIGRTGGKEAMTQLFATREGFRLAGNVLRLVKAIENKELLSVQERTASADAASKRALQLALIFSVGAFFLIGVTAWLLKHELTKRLRAQSELLSATAQRAESLSNFRTILAGAPDGMITIAENGRITFANRQALRIFGCETEDITGKSLEALIPGSLTAALAERAASRFATQNQSVGQLFGRQKNGTEFPVELSASPIREEGRSHVVVSIRDVTEQRKAEQRNLETLREKETLLKEIHHRVKNNLNIISSLLDLQLHGIRDPELRETFREGQNRIFSMALIHEKLYQSSNLARINFKEYLRDLVVSLYHSYGVDPRQFPLELKVDDVFFEVDMAVPCSLLVNELVSNVFKHAFKKASRGSLGVTLRAFDGAKPWAYELSVSDDGCGLPQGMSLENSSSLGLKLVKALSKQMAGEVSFRSDKGAEFTVHFGKRGPAEVGGLEHVV